MDDMQNVDIAAEAQHNVIGVQANAERSASFKRTTHPDAQWFENAGLGLFIHWGISSVHGGIDISWSMMLNSTWDLEYEGKNKITPAEYFKLADKFNPENYDPDKWIRAAADAGFRYAILTTKHHDGYALWPSEYSDFCTGTHMGGRDLLKPYVDACRKYGLKVGFYYSPPDWHFNKDYYSFDLKDFKVVEDKRKQEIQGYDVNHKLVVIPSKPEEFHNKYKEYIRNQVKELLTRYGKIDIMWFDGCPEVISIDEIREFQPGIVVNPRMHGYGDFESPECELPKERPAGWWEACLIWNYHEWGYQEPHGYRPTGWMLNLLARCRAWKGNLLMNCAPKGDGTMPDIYYERMKELAEWMKYGKESVFNIEPGPYPEKSNVPVTIKDNTWYLHMLPEEDDIKGRSWYLHLLVPGKEARSYPVEMKTAKLLGVQKPKVVKLLRTGEEIPYKYDNSELAISINADKCTQLDDVVAVIW